MNSYFDHLIGNEHVKVYLTRMFQNNKVGNSLLFAGPDGVGKSLFAHELAKMMICCEDLEGKHRRKIESGNHPDIRIYQPEGKIGMHSIDSLRQFTEEVYLPPYEAKWKFFIVHDADRMLVYSANALLKTFEEPAPNSIIVLLSSSPALLLPTILSRCRTIRFHAIPTDSIAKFLQETKGVLDEGARQIAVLARGSMGAALRLFTDGKDPMREFILNLLVKGKMSTYSQLIKAAGEINEKIESAKKNVDDSVRTSLLKKLPQDLTAFQKQNLEKEIEGAISMQVNSTVTNLFEVVLAWYRDLHLLKVDGNLSFLFHPDYLPHEKQALEREEPLSLEEVQEVLSDAKLSLARSTAINIIFENLFLQLNFI
jgi:DNA polymerase III subunit delta'